jgi:hypothetical protein
MSFFYEFIFLNNNISDNENVSRFQLFLSWTISHLKRKKDREEKGIKEKREQQEEE